MISSYYPFVVEKGVALRVFLHFSLGASATPAQADVTATTLDCYISKDGGAWAHSVNSVGKVAKNDSLSISTRGLAYIDLTATEMNADNVVITIALSGSVTSNTEPPTFVIKTGKLNKVLEVLDKRLKKGNQKL